jgi:hypothetical protein
MPGKVSPASAFSKARQRHRETIVTQMQKKLQPVLVDLLRSQGTDSYPELEFLKSLWGLGTVGIGLSYNGWRNSFLGIDSWAP